MKRFVLYLTTLMLLSGCEHHDIVCPPSDSSGVEVKFNWLMAPGADPAGMTVWFYGAGLTDNSLDWRFDLKGSTGGGIRLPYATYDVISYNTDPLNVYVADMESLQGIRACLKSASLPVPPGQSIPPTDNTETLRATPDRLWISSSDRYEVGSCCCNGGNNIVELFPENPLADYEVRILDVENLKGLRYASATLDGMVWSMSMCDLQPTGGAAPGTLAFVVGRDDDTTLSARFKTLHDHPEAGRHTLTLYCWMADKTGLRYVWDVTDQVVNAPDADNVTIIIRGLKLPEVEIPDPPIGDDAFEVGVDGWKTVYISL